MGMGGLGTIQSVMGARDIYGRDVDILVWDSAMTEPADSPDFDLFARQGILGSDRAPVLWAGKDDKKIYPALQEHADVDYMMYGTGLGPIPPVTDPTTVDQIPWAARYLKCENEWHRLCNDNKFNGTCWIERPDHFVPPTPQKAAPGGRSGWHDVEIVKASCESHSMMHSSRSLFCFSSLLRYQNRAIECTSFTGAPCPLLS